MTENERKLYERGIDYETQLAKRFLALCDKHQWSVDTFLDLAVRLKYVYQNERKN